MLTVYKYEISTNLLFFQSAAIIASRKKEFFFASICLIDINEIFSSYFLKLSYSQGGCTEKVT